MVQISVLVVGLVLLYVAVTGRAESVYKALTKPKESSKDVKK